MKKQLILLAVSLGACLSLMTVPAHAQGIWEGCNGSTAICSDKTEATTMIERIVNLLLLALGAVAVILIIHSGLKYVTSRGDPANVKSAKDTLMYAVIGLIVALLSYAIVGFVLSRFGTLPLIR